MAGVGRNGPCRQPLFSPVQSACTAQNSRSVRASHREVGKFESTPGSRIDGPALAELPSEQDFEIRPTNWNDIGSLAILLEPVYWPGITGSLRLTGGTYHENLLNDYRRDLSDFVETLDPNIWQDNHRVLITDAFRIDANSESYVLLRVGATARKLTGQISGALWIRHIAEVIRRAFEDAHNQLWPEEYNPREDWPRKDHSPLRFRTPIK